MKALLRRLWRKLRRLPPKPEEMVTEQVAWGKMLDEVKRKKRPDPLMLGDRERHEATAKLVRRMKWSKGFVEAMKTPMVLRALENGGYARDPLTGDELQLTTTEMARLEGVTRKNFRQFQNRWADHNHSLMNLTLDDEPKQIAPAWKSQGPCETTSTERFENPLCQCPTYPGNLGPCREFEEGGNGRCVYCDHTLECHLQLAKTLQPETSFPQQPVR